jgi:hypothetical protein
MFVIEIVCVAQIELMTAMGQRPACSPPDDALRSMSGMAQIPGMLGGRTSTFS